MKNFFTYSFKVSKNEIDELNHVNNLIYIRWALDAAQKHWDFLSSNEMNNKYVWVVLRHEIDYMASAKLNDEILIKTWVEKSVGVKSERIVEIKCGEKQLVKATTTWCLLDIKTMKPNRIPLEIIDLFQ
jgi:acyl-CoA thioester hydrolase